MDKAPAGISWIWWMAVSGSYDLVRQWDCLETDLPNQALDGALNVPGGAIDACLQFEMARALLFCISECRY